MKHKQTSIVFLLLFSIFLNSCLGISMDITMNKNGSGIIAIEYKVSRTLETLGRLDGNEKWNTVPVGKADIERTIERLPGVRLISFNSREDKTDMITDIKMEFSTPSDLMAFLDAPGRISAISGDGNSGKLFLRLSDSEAIKNPGLKDLIEDISKNYAVRIGMTFHDQGQLSLSDNFGNDITIPGSEIVSMGKTVSFSIPLYEILSSTDGICAEFKWQ